MPLIDEKLAHLKSLIHSFESCLIAYSGGVDSALLAVIGFEVLGEKSLATIADSPSLPRHELDEARAISLRFGFPLKVIRTSEFENQAYVSNPINRCYFCRAELFEKMISFASEHEIKVIAYGENATDVMDFRPGRLAAEQYKVRAPLREVGLGKDEIRELSHHYGLPTAEKPAQPCLSSRIPHGEVVNVKKLRLIEAGEKVLRDCGFREFRLRLHELKNGFLARLEVSSDELPNLFKRWNWLGKRLSEIGFCHITIDLLGYQFGGMKKGMKESMKKSMKETSSNE